MSVEAWTMIRYLHAQGLGIRRIAAQLGLARNTVRDGRPGRPIEEWWSLRANESEETNLRTNPGGKPVTLTTK